MTVIAVQLFHPLISPSTSSLKPSTLFFHTLSLKTIYRNRKLVSGIVWSAKEDTQLQIPINKEDDDDDKNDEVQFEEEEEVEPTAEDLENIFQIKSVLELLKKNRDMLFSEVKLTVMIEDPREVERLRLLGIDESDAPTREDLAAVLEEVNEGKIPRDTLALKMLAEEMVQWPNLEVEVEPTKKTRKKSLYAKATDTGIDPEVAAKRLNIDWDSAADIEDAEVVNDTDVPSVVGFAALYIVSALPIIIGVSVVLILFYNSLQ